MARQAATAMEDGVHLLVQAGTGTGKSLAYLIPALNHALGKNERVVISTATLALQRQLMTRDIPLVTKAVGDKLGRPAEITLLKGRQNYVCKHKLHGGMPDEPDSLFDLAPRGQAAEEPSGLGRSEEHTSELQSRGPRFPSTTLSRSLQRQLMTRDIPLVTKAVGDKLGRPAEITLLKGRQNYVCKHKLHGGMPDEPDSLFDLAPRGQAAEEPSGLGAEVVRLRKWAQETETGDRDDLVPGVSEKAWRQVSVSALECLGAAKCPMASECFSEQVREDAQSADVVVTNHAMLALSTTGENSVLPEHDVVIVDEAHELAQRVTAAVTGELSPTAVEAAARTVRRHAGLPTTDLDAGAQSLAGALEQTPAGWLEQGLPAATADAVAGIHTAARELLSIIRTDDKSSAGSSADSHKQLAHAALDAIFEVCERIVSANAHDVVWCTQPSDWDDRKPALHIAPLNVAGLLRNSVLEKRSAIFTSATLKLGGEFTSIARGIGLEGPEGGTWRAADVGSPFDYASQGILYVARHLPRPGEDPDQTHTEVPRAVCGCGFESRGRVHLHGPGDWTRRARGGNLAGRRCRQPLRLRKPRHFVCRAPPPAAG